VTGVEIDETACCLAAENSAANGLEACLDTVRADLRHRACLPEPGTFDLVISNPPYFPAGSGVPSPDASRRGAREERCTPEELAAAAAALLRWGGRFSLVHRPERLADLICALRSAGVEPKRLRFAARAADAPPSLVLLEGRRGGRPGLTVEPPLPLWPSDAPATPLSAAASPPIPGKASQPSRPPSAAGATAIKED
jgi:tRNA1(Val) A37 N6-methylase TrmN6